MKEIEDDREAIHEDIQEEERIAEDLGELEAETVVMKPEREERERLRARHGRPDEETNNTAEKD